MNKPIEDILTESISNCEFGNRVLHPLQIEALVLNITLVLEANGIGSQHDAWQKGVETALDNAIENEDGMTLRLEHLDGRPWINPYPKVSEE